MSETRCDLHGPYSPEQTALLVRGDWKHERTGYLCSRCQAAVSECAKEMADAIDADILAQAGA